jgi:outer membrane autotransporter protein
MWAQAQVGGERLSRVEDFTISGFSFSPNLSTNSDWRGFQMGGDTLTAGNWHYGFTGGFLEQNSAFRVDHNSFDLTGWNVGAYAGFTHGSFFANGLVKTDWYDIKANLHTVPALETFSGNTWGVKGEAGWRMGTPHLYFEPLADLAWTTTHLDDANFPLQATTFTFGNGESLRGSIGARLGGQWGSILPYVGLYVADEFDGKNQMTMITGGGCPGACMTIEDQKPGAYERADFGFTTTSWNGLEGFLKGEAEFGGHTDGFTGRLGVRWRW